MTTQKDRIQQAITKLERDLKNNSFQFSELLKDQGEIVRQIDATENEYAQKLESLREKEREILAKQKELQEKELGLLGQKQALESIEL